MTTSEDDMLRDMLRSFRGKEIEPAWEGLDAPEAQRFVPLWDTLAELGVTLFGLREAHGGLALSASARLGLFRELGAACPALGAALLGHVTAQRLLSAAAADGALPASMTDARLALIGSPLDTIPDGSLALWNGPDGGLRLRGQCRVMWPHPTLLCIPVSLGGAPRLCLLPADEVTFAETPSSHGLCLLQFGTLGFEDQPIGSAQVLPWPVDGVGEIAREADALLASLLAGVHRELAERAGQYALERFQGGKMIHEHDAVRQLVGPIELGRRAIEALAQTTLDACADGDGSASAFATELSRQAGLDAIQTFGGYGYMEDYRVERYLRDTNTLENMWVHADARRRAIAAAHFTCLAS